MSDGVPTTSSDGLRSKNPNGLSQKDTTSTGITGQSSGRVMWWMPNTYHITTSVFSIERLASVHRPSPVSLLDWLTNSPAGHRSSGPLGVTHQVCRTTFARSTTGDSGAGSGGVAPLGTNLYDGWGPRPVTTLVCST